MIYYILHRSCENSFNAWIFVLINVSDENLCIVYIHSHQHLYFIHHLIFIPCRLIARAANVYCLWSVRRLIKFYSILFYSILFYFILFYSILFYSFLFFSFLFFSSPEVVVIELMAPIHKHLDNVRQAVSYLGLLSLTEIIYSLGDKGFDHIHIKQWDMITHPCPNLNGGLAEPQLWLKHKS